MVISKSIRVLNLGAGVQSTTIALMIHRGELPPIDCAVFADTQEESKATYDHLDWLINETKASFKTHVITKAKLGSDLLLGRNSTGQSFAAIPAFTQYANSNQPEGIVRRQCTHEYKLKPIEKFIRH